VTGVITCAARELSGCTQFELASGWSVYSPLGVLEGTTFSHYLGTSRDHWTRSVTFYSDSSLSTPAWEPAEVNEVVCVA
jgi:hypothetical protein